MNPLQRVRYIAVLLASLAASCRVGPIGAGRNPVPSPARAPEIVAASDRMAARDLWPGFDPRAIPVAIFDGRLTWLFRHPAPPDGFGPAQGRSGVHVYPGRHPSVTANTSTRLGGTETAVLMIDSTRTTRRALAAVLIHESFHVFQRLRHPSWTANEAELFTYPTDDVEALALRRLETQALRRALASGGEASACWARSALGIRDRRLARVGDGAASYERGIEQIEGLAEYVEARARGGEIIVRLPQGEYAPGAVRQRGYTVGLALARLLDRHLPGWRGRLERGDSTALDALLGDAVGAREGSDTTCAFPPESVEAARLGAERDVSTMRERLAELRREFLARDGWTLIVEAERPPLFPQGFDPLNVQRLSNDEVLHTRWLRLGGQAGTVEVMGRPALTRAAGEHPLFSGVRALVVSGLPREPVVDTTRGRVVIAADAVRADLAGAMVEVVRGTRTVWVRVQ